ncbi:MULTISPECIES: hypothetical protein [Asanoa]|uniref:Uncharacterized protein n=2 Tax=Asanoa TaxID=195964 RepID=A0A239PGF7_9ACTN|nr:MULTISPECIES: hypothetical protein [Asanoa]GIF74172.1 hypothetical protein Asi02nite_36900 [Asanoa siamensis]SNT65688.1 hypothetical protein SAMN05421812_12531 [Asanoa hainanensis]
MDRIGQDQHADLAAELGQRVGQGIAVLSTLTEASARLAAEEMRRRARREEQQHTDEDRRDRDAQRLAGESDKLAQYAARQRVEHDQRVVGQAADPDWLARADLLDLATVWRTARAREHEGPEYAEAAERVEERLRQMYPRPMDLYDQRVSAGVPRADAMRTAAQEMARTPVMRAHGGGRAAALHPGDVAIGEAAFAAAVTDEQIRLSTGVDPRDYAEQLDQLGAGGAAAAQALRETLAARAGQDLADGRSDAATPDNPATAVNEHTTGLVDHKRATADGERDSAAAGTRNAAQLAAEWYPEGLNHPAALPGHVAGKRPAATSPTRTAGRTR